MPKHPAYNIFNILPWFMTSDYLSKNFGLNLMRMASFGTVSFVSGNENFFGNNFGNSSLYTYPNISQRSQAPVTTGTSVLGMKFNGGVVIAADMLGSYGSLARFRNCPRVMKVNDNIILGAGGDYADFQYLKDIIEQKIIDEQCLDDGFTLKPKSLYCWLTRVLYNRRSKFDPFWNNFIVGGIQDGETFLGTVDKLGTAYVDDHIATSYGGHIALPLMRDVLEKAKPEGLNKDEAKKLMVDCLRILLYRDARSFSKYQIALLTSEGVTLEGPLDLDTNWEVAHMVSGY